MKNNDNNKVNNYIIAHSDATFFKILKSLLIDHHNNKLTSYSQTKTVHEAMT